MPGARASGIVGERAHEDGAEGGAEAGGDGDGGEGHAGLVQDGGVDEDNVGHGDEGGEAGEGLGAPRGAVMGEGEVSFQARLQGRHGFSECSGWGRLRRSTADS